MEAPEATATYDVLLTSRGASEADLSATIEELTGLDAAEARQLMVDLPARVLTGVSHAVAQGTRSRLESIGAGAEVRPSSGGGNVVS